MSQAATTNASAHAAAPAADLRPVVHKLEFTGNGAEWFRIWIVNVLLTIVTLGIYSAWAKVRRLRYFYQNTRLEGSAFDYHGSPVAILKGRAIVFGGIGLMHAFQHVNLAIYYALAFVVTLASPWLLRRSFQFRLYNTSYRGLRFGFVGDNREAYRVFLLWPLITGLTLGLAWPWAHQRIKRYQHANARFGAAAFRFKATGRDFLRIYVKISLISLVPLVLVAIAAVSMGRLDGGAILLMTVGLGLLFITFAAMALLVGPLLRAWIHNLVWNNTRLGPHRFRATVSARRYTWIVFTNFILTMLTLGFYRPFAQVRLARYMTENMLFACFGGIEQFIAGTEQQVAAAGEEFAEAFDLDIGL